MFKAYAAFFVIMDRLPERLPSTVKWSNIIQHENEDYRIKETKKRTVGWTDCKGIVQKKASIDFLNEFMKKVLK